jgi:hypothetical protein
MKLELATYEAVKYACLYFHYAKSIPVQLCSYSVFNEKGEWCGCIVFSSGSNGRLGKKFGLVQGEWCELVRMALNGKQESTSKALSISLKLLKKHNPLLKLVISYADCDQDHTGIIYQATNWIYEGKVQLNGGTPRIKILGKSTHARTIGKRGWKCNLEWLKKHIDPSAEHIFTTGKHKYLYPLTKELKNICEPLRQPYPKKENIAQLAQLAVC